MDVTKLKTDENLKAEGRWCELGDGRVLVARAGNRRFDEAFRRYIKPHVKTKGRFGQVDVDPDRADVAEKKAASEYILLDWENFYEGEAKTPVKYSPTKAFEYFRNHPQFWEKIRDLSREVATDYDEELAESLGNSKGSCNGAFSSSPETSKP